MLNPSKKTFYAIEAVLFIAYNAKTEPVAGNEVAAAQNLPVRYLEPIMQKLVRVGILRGVRGPTGGYMLGRERRRITIADIYTVITNHDGLPESNTALGKEILHPAFTQLMQRWREEMAHITIADLCDHATTANIATTIQTTNDFTI